MIDQENGLPVGWTLTTLGQVCKTTSGGTPSRKFKEYFQGDIPWVKSGELPDNVISTVEEYITKEALTNSSAKLFPEDTLLIALYGATVGKLGILKKTAATNQAVCAIFPKVDLCTKYLFWYLRFIRSYLISQAVGGAQPNINQSILQNLPIHLAPLPEQHRIVAEIEKQVSRLDEAVAGLKRIQANLKRYRASVLKSAVEGKLTAKWRKQHPDTEPAEQLLQRILKERREHWEQAEQEKMQGAGKPPKDDKWKQKYKEPIAPDVSSLPVLPEGWIWGSFEQVAERVTVGFVGSMKHQYVDSGIPFLRSQNVRENRYEPQGLKYISQEFHQQIKKSSLVPDDLVVVRSGSVGVTCVLPETLGIANCSDLVIIKRPIGFIPKYGAYYMNSIVNTRVASKKVGVALTHFNTQSVAQMPIPLPPLQEQTQIVLEIERRLSIADEVEQQINTNLKRAERLRQSILKKAFSGRLVPQDSNDEPADMLLEKIKQAQRA
ncbi:MAG: restriction endonuclease subunit S [Methylobacter sp.]|nr:restriction endonuclease subunit S [Methylobacter sp.]